MLLFFLFSFPFAIYFPFSFFGPPILKIRLSTIPDTFLLIFSNFKACNVTYLCSVDTESLTGPEAVRRSTAFVLKLLLRHELRAVPIHIKVSVQGITLTVKN